MLGLLFGSATIAPLDVLRVVAHHLGLLPGHISVSAPDQSIVWDLRLPRVLAAALVGCGLAVAGSLFQAVLRNPLADPYVIGTSAGAQVGVAVAVILPIQFGLLGFDTTQALAFAGAVLTVLFVYALARSGPVTPVVTLVLAGFVTSSFLISLTTFIAVASNRTSQILLWTLGGVAVTEWSQLAAAAFLILAASAAAFLLARQLDVILLGEDQATYLGVRVETLKLAAVTLGSLLTAMAVSLAGVVAFVGLVSPHAVRLVYGPGHRLLIPLAAVAGAIFLVVADLISRVVLAPTEIPLGVITPVVGAPLFLYLLRRNRRGYGV
jgi:iron complex transport system permease protein